MPKVDLMGEFNTLFPGSPDTLEQRSFYFERSPDVYFINGQGRIIRNYDELPAVELTQEEQALFAKQAEPKLNEAQILVKAVKYEGDKIYIQACKCDYKFLVAYDSGKVFPADSAIYQQTFFKTGSIAALVTSDNKSVIVERNDAWKLFSSFSGFLKPQRLAEENVAITSAVEEAQEKFLQYTNIRLRDEATIGSLSFRKGNKTGKFGTAEFIVHLPVDCSEHELSQALNEQLISSKKPDGQPDHTGRYKIINPANISERDFDIAEQSGAIKKIRDVSFFLVDPVISTVCRFLSVQVPEFMQKQSLNEMIAARHQQERKEEDEKQYRVDDVVKQAEGWCAYLTRRASECLRSKGGKEL